MSKNIKENYLKIIQNNFPNIQFSTTKLITKWWSNDIIILDNDIIFRFPKEEFTKNNFFKEIELLNIIQKEIKNIQIPHYKYISKNPVFWWYNIIKWIEFNKSHLKNNLKKEQIAEQIWQFLTQLHSIDLNKFAWLLDIEADKHYSFEAWYIDYVMKQYKEIEDKFSTETFAKIIKFIQESKDYAINNPCLTHYDFQWKNIIISEDRKKINWIIDFSDIAIYDPAIDFVWLLWFPKSFLDKVLENYKINNWDLLNRATYYKNKQLIFTFPEVYKKFWDSKQIRKIELLFIA